MPSDLRKDKLAESRSYYVEWELEGDMSIKWGEITRNRCGDLKRGICVSKDLGS